MDEFEQKQNSGENNTENTPENTTTIRRVVRRGDTAQQPVTRVVVRRQPVVREAVSEHKNQYTPASPAEGDEDSCSKEYQEDADPIKKVNIISENREKPVCKYNRIILIGMPCSGKSSIGRSVAMICGYDFIDMDDYIESYAGKSIADIFSKPNGEADFRKLETEVAALLAEKNHVVIASGGGAVTREETMKNLKTEGSFTVFIHRDFFKIATTPQRIMDKRPLFENTSFDALLNTYKTRIPLYRKYADIQVENDKNREDAVVRIKEKIF